MNKINKIILSENLVYEGTVDMPKGWHVKKEEVVKHITVNSLYTNYTNTFCRELARVETYILDYLRAEQKIKLETSIQNKGLFFERNERSKPFIEHNICDYVCLYGVQTDSDTCKVVINFDNNTYTKDLETDTFIIIPSRYMYYVENENNSLLNFINKFFFFIPS